MAYAWEQARGDVKDLERRILEQLATGSKRRLELQRAIFDSTFVGSYEMIDALRWLVEHRYIEAGRGRAYKVTEAGRNALALADMCDVAK